MGGAICNESEVSASELMATAVPSPTSSHAMFNSIGITRAEAVHGSVFQQVLDLAMVGLEPANNK